MKEKRINITNQISERGLGNLITTISRVRTDDINIQFNGCDISYNTACDFASYLMSLEGRRINLTFVGKTHVNLLIIAAVGFTKGSVKSITGNLVYKTSSDNMSDIIDRVAFYTDRDLYIDNHMDFDDNWNIKDLLDHYIYRKPVADVPLFTMFKNLFK